MSLVNKVILLGNLGQDPEIKTFGEGQHKVSVSLATNEFTKNKSGEKVQETQWHNLVLWGKRAETMHRLCKKGSKIMIEGKLINRSYETADGEKKYIQEIRVNEFELLDKKLEAAPF